MTKTIKRKNKPESLGITCPWSVKSLVVSKMKQERIDLYLDVFYRLQDKIAQLCFKTTEKAE